MDTQLIHAGEPRPRILGSVTMPVFQSVTFEHPDPNGRRDMQYIRMNNTPNHLVLNAKLAALEGAEAALVTASGMAAITTTLLALVGSGDHILAQSRLYGGTHGFLTEECPALGIGMDWIDPAEPASWERKLKPTTRVVYVETMSNPLLEVGDLEAIVRFAQGHGLTSVIDNTFATPINFRPPEVGFDLSLHSCTKYLNGHDDIAAGAVIGRAPLIERIAHRLSRLGGSLDPHAAFLLHRGLKTLGVRVRHQNVSATRVARFLVGHPAVRHVNYPGLESHPRHTLARELFEGFGGVLSFDLDGGAAAAESMYKKLRLAVPAPSLGGVDSLVMRPAVTSHVGMSPEERARVGIGDGLVRLSVGLETTEDLIADLDQALRS